MNSIARRFLLNQPAKPHAPLILFLHGTGGNAKFTADETDWPHAATSAGYALAIPDALPIHADLPIAFLSNPQRWNDGSTQPGSPLHSEAEDVSFLSTLVQHLVQNGIADPQRVYLTGFSNGAGMVFRMAAERPELIAAIAPVAGYCPSQMPPFTQAVPTLYMVGDADPLIPEAGGLVASPWTSIPWERPALAKMLADWAERMHCGRLPQIEREQDGIREEVYRPLQDGAPELRRISIRGLGHHWPGGKGRLNPRIGGPTHDLLNANSTLLSYFENIYIKHSLTLPAQLS